MLKLPQRCRRTESISEGRISEHTIAFCRMNTLYDFYLIQIGLRLIISRFVFETPVHINKEEDNDYSRHEL